MTLGRTIALSFYGCLLTLTAVAQGVTLPDARHVVLDNGHRVAFIHQLLEDVDQALNIGHVQPRGRFVQDIQRVTVGSFDQLFG